MSDWRAVDAATFTRLRDEIHERSFSPGQSDCLVGAEAELLVHDESTGRPVPLLEGRRPLVPVLRRYAGELGWHERSGYGAVPSFEIPHHGIVSFEPGGQLEVSTLPAPSGSNAAAHLRAVVLPLRRRLAADGIRLESRGIDAVNDATDIEQQLPADRYRRMTEYFESIGPFGIRMMRQTAAIQISLDRGPEPAARWRLLNDLAPYLVAMFANSPRYRGEETGHRSFRAHCWRMLDPTRTGVAIAADDPAAEYTRFALGAHDMMRRDLGGDFRRYGDWPLGDHAGDRWATHLTTLFPEVRPRGHFEVRSCDAIDPEWYVVPILVVSALAYDVTAAHDASILAGESRALLRRAGTVGLRDAAIARTSRDLFQLALSGAVRLGPGVFSEADVDTAREYYDRYTARAMSPADDARLELPRDGAPGADVSRRAMRSR